MVFWASLMAQQVKKPLSMQETQEIGFSPWVGKIPWWRKMANPLQYSSLENPMDRGAWWATIHGVSELDTPDTNCFPKWPYHLQSH